MVYFKHSKSTKRTMLVSVNKADDSIEKGVKHIVHPSVMGAFASKWLPMQYPKHLDYWCKEEDLSGLKTSQPILSSSHHQDQASTVPFKILRNSLALEEAKWSSNQEFGSEFTYIPFYWEWLEDILRNCRAALRDVQIIDAVHASLFLYSRNIHLVESLCEHWCSKTNTLVTATGEVSISLWDIRYLTGLPIVGALYDEVIPCLSELVHSNEEDIFYLPPSCKHLFAAYHRMMSKNKSKKQVSFEDWCRFWFRGALKYSSENVPIPKKNFSSYGTPQPWNDDHAALQDLKIPGTHRAQTYLAAFLSCWICSFVLPVRDLGHIRPGVFKVASLLASGKKFSLAIPVLASIYRGLNEISTSNLPGKYPGYFASHYVYAWLARYYHSHRIIDHGYLEAAMIAYEGVDAPLSLPVKNVKDFIPSGERIIWRCTSFGSAKDEKHVDVINNHVSIAEALIAMRSSFLTLRHEEYNIIEPYSPHRFARQFGFCQDIPGELEHDIRKGDLERLSQLFGSSTTLGSKSNFIIPSRDLALGSTTTTAYAAYVKTTFSLLYPLEAPVPSRSSNSCDDSHTTKLGKRKLESVITRATPESPIVNSNPSKKRNLKLKFNQARLENPASQDTGTASEKIDTCSVKNNSLSTSDDTDKPGYENILGLFDGCSEADPFDYSNETGQGEMNIADELAASNINLADCGMIDDDISEIVENSELCKAYSQEIEASKVEIATESSVNFQSVILQAERQAVVFAVTSVVNSMREKLLSSSYESLTKCKNELDEVSTYASSKDVDISAFVTPARMYLSQVSELKSLKHDPSCQILTSKIEADLEAISVKEETLKKELADLSQKREALNTALVAEKESTEKIRCMEKVLSDTRTTLEKLKFSA